MSDLPSAILVISSASHGISFATATGSASSAIALTMSIGSMPAVASTASDIISAVLARLSCVFMTSPGMPYAARPGDRSAVPALTVGNRIRPDKAGMSRA